MADLEKAITTQEELNEVIKDRLKRAEDKYSKKYEGFLSPEDVEAIKKDYDDQITKLNAEIQSASEKVSKYDNDIAERDAKIKEFETSAIKSRVIRDCGLNYDAMQFIQGEDEESIKASAEALKSLVGNKPAAPLASGYEGQQTGINAELSRLANELIGNTN